MNVADYDMENCADQGLKVLMNTFQYNSSYRVKVEFKNYFWLLIQKGFQARFLTVQQGQGYPHDSIYVSILWKMNPLVVAATSIKFNLLCIRSDWKVFACFEDIYIKFKKIELVKISHLSHMWINWSNAEMNLKSIPTDSTFK